MLTKKSSSQEIRAAILWRLAISPMNLAEIEDELRVDPPTARPILLNLMQEKMVRRIINLQRGGAFFCLAGYQEEEIKVECAMPYDYSAHYANPFDDNRDGTFSGIREW